jgi:hypothetical protein
MRTWTLRIAQTLAVERLYQTSYGDAPAREKRGNSSSENWLLRDQPFAQSA